MKNTRFARLLACLSLFPLAAGAAAPERIEQGNLIYEGIPLAEVNQPTTLPSWSESRSAGFAGWLADGSLLITTRFGNATQLHRVRTPLGMREQLTFEAGPVDIAVAHPHDANQLLYLKDVNGNEVDQVWLRDIAKHSDKLLSDGKSRHERPVFAHDGRQIAWTSNARDPASNDIFIADATGATAPRFLMAGGGDALYVMDWSADDRKLAVARYRSNTDSELLLVDVATGEQTPIEPGAAAASGKAKNRKQARLATPVSVGSARFSRDGRGLYFTSDRGGEFIGLHYIDIYTRQLTTLTPGARWDAQVLGLGEQAIALGDDGHYLAYGFNEAGVSRLVVRDLKTSSDLVLPPLPANAVVSGFGFDPAGKQLAVALSTAAQPGDVYVYGLEGAPTVTLTRWTQSELGPIDPARLVPAQRVEFPTWDAVDGRQRVISAFVMKPAASAAHPATAGRHPVIIDIHGGPESQFQPSFSSFRQYLVNELGYAVIGPNVRGSSGYGRTFLTLDDGVLREDAVRDIGALLVWIGLQPDLDTKRVVVMGGSYGGYMTLASMVHYSDRLAGGIDIVGISNFVTFLTNTSAYRRDLRRVEYGDERDPKMRAALQNMSPLTHVAKMGKPLLVVQGLNDPRVPASQSELMTATLRARGGEVWYLAAKDEGHGFAKKANTDAQRAVTVAFLRKLAGP